MKAKAAIILTDYRTGGTFLSLALDSHPLVYCCRAEPLSKTSPWWEHLGASGPILDIVFRQEMCKVAMCKLIYRQVGPAVWTDLKDREARVVHLVRTNELRASCSYLFHKQVRIGNVKKRSARRKLHAYKPVQERVLIPRPMALPTNTLLSLMRERVKARQKALRKALDVGLEVERVTYEEMIGGEQAEASEVRPVTAQRLCKFLSVEPRTLFAPTRKVNAYPLWILVSNWATVEKVIKDTEFAADLELEGKWVQEEGTWIAKG